MFDVDVAAVGARVAGYVVCGGAGRISEREDFAVGVWLSALKVKKLSEDFAFGGPAISAGAIFGVVDVCFRLTQGKYH